VQIEFAGMKIAIHTEKNDQLTASKLAKEFGSTLADKLK
jgi:hypothetical protein